jgi:hypothetical protein
MLVLIKLGDFPLVSIASRQDHLAKTLAPPLTTLIAQLPRLKMTPRTKFSKCTTWTIKTTALSVKTPIASFNHRVYIDIWEWKLRGLVPQKPTSR